MDSSIPKPVGDPHDPDADPLETREWIEALDALIQAEGPERATFLLRRLLQHARTKRVPLPQVLATPYINTIALAEQPPYQGNLEIEARLSALVRWNALAMVVRANRASGELGGHIASYASAADLFEVGFNHFFRAGDRGDLVYFQPHSAPGVYARAFLEGRLTEENLDHYRRETGGKGLSSYPHPWLMPSFWQFPTGSMGLAPIHAIYQARFMRYLENRNLIARTPRKVWAFVGDGETDEPESMGSLTLASREKLDNLIFVVNCNLQRLDGPVRGNGKIINELEAAYRGAGWNVIKVIWGGDWDRLLARDTSGLLLKRMEECVDGEYQNFKAKGGAYIRKEFFGKYPETLKLVEHLSDEQVGKLRRGGHDPQKVYNAYRAAVEHKGQPTLILAKTVKGYGVAEIEARNPTHQQKELNDRSVQLFRQRFDVQLPEDVANNVEFYKPPDGSPEMAYLHERRRQLGGYIPERKLAPSQIQAPPLENFADLMGGSKAPHPSTTMAFVRLLTTLMKNPQIGKRVVPIIP